MGVRRNGAFHAFDWGEPNWSEIEVQGDQVYWYNVFPDVDLSVRYIHDILKVDVIVRADLMKQIRGDVQQGTLDAQDYLTARFDIPSVWITSDACLGEKQVDLYTENLDEPLQFVKNDKVVHKLSPVTAYVLDSMGDPIYSFDEESAIRTNQLWQLNKDASGVAEMSACLGDLAKAPEGGVGY